MNARQQAVLLQVARGATDTEIGRRLGYSRRGIGVILDNARAKLGARNRTQAAALWLASSLPEPLAGVWLARLGAS